MADIGSGLKAVGIPVKGRVGVFGANSPEWMVTMQARLVVPTTSHATWMEHRNLVQAPVCICQAQFDGPSIRSCSDCGCSVDWQGLPLTIR